MEEQTEALVRAALVEGEAYIHIEDLLNHITLLAIDSTVQGDLTTALVLAQVVDMLSQAQLHS